MKSIHSLFLKCFVVGLTVAAVSAGMVDPLIAQEGVQPADSAAFADLPPLERSRQFLIAREFQAALTAAEEAAEQEGLQPASSTGRRYTSASDRLASIHLYRGLSLELQRMFPEAIADYETFLSIEPDSWRADELRKRLPYASGQSVRARARALSYDGVTPDSASSEYGVGVFPLYNASSILVMSQLSFGLTGILNNTVGLLDHFSDRSLPRMPYSQLRLLLDEILPEEVHGSDATIEIGELTRVLGVEFVASGILDEVSGSLTGELRLGDAADLSTTTISEIQSSYTAEGLIDLQRALSLTIADTIQARTGFTYVPSRQAFADSVERYLMADVGKLLTYGFAVEQMILGEPIEAQALMMDLPDLVAQRDLEQFDDIAKRSTPPADNLNALTSLTPIAVTPPSVDPAPADTTVGIVATEDRPEPPPAPAPSDLEERTAHVLSAAAARHLSGYSLWGPTQRPLVFDGARRDDPRKGVAGTLDPTRKVAGETGVPIEVVIPLPPSADRPSHPER